MRMGADSSERLVPGCTASCAFGSFTLAGLIWRAARNTGRENK